MVWVPLSYDRVLKVSEQSGLRRRLRLRASPRPASVAADGTVTTRHLTVSSPSGRRSFSPTIPSTPDLGPVPGQQVTPSRQPHQHRRPPAPGRLGPLPGDHHLRGLRAAHGRLLRQPATSLRLPALPLRPRPDPGLPLRASRHHRRAGRPCLLEALTGEEVGLASAAADEVADRRARIPEPAELAVERARYHAGRAERALLAVEPENRLVARSFEARYEARLQELAEAEAALAAAQTTKTPLPDRAELQDGGRRPRHVVGRSHHHRPGPQTPPANPHRRRHRDPGTDPAKIRIGVRWHSGASDEIVTERVTSICEARRTPSHTVEFVRRLGPTTDNASLAEQLNPAGHRTGTGRRFDSEAVRALRRSYGIPPAGLLAAGEATVKDVATRLGVTRSTIIAWIDNGRLTARRHPSGRFIVAFDSDIEAACRHHIATSRQIHREPHTATSPRRRTNPAQVADHLGISRDALYNWIARGYLPARHGPGGHAYISFTAQIQAECWQRIANSPQLPRAAKTKALQHITGDAL